MMWKDKIRKSEFSFFEEPLSNIVPRESTNIIDIYNFIKDDSLIIIKNNTNHLRNIINNKFEYNKYKISHFPYVTFSGVFKTRKTSDLIHHSGLICLDLDHLGRKLYHVHQTINQDLDHVVMTFRSPGGNGLKVVYAVDLSKGSHDDWFQNLNEHLKELLQDERIEVDVKCKDVARACLIPHDPEVFINPRLIDGSLEDVLPIASTKNLKTSYKPLEPEVGVDIRILSKQLKDLALNYESPNSEENFLKIYLLTEKKDGPYKRPRKIWIHRLASRCNLFGMDEIFCKKSVVKYLANHPSSHDDTDPLRINEHFIKPVSSTYNTYKLQHASWEKWERKRIETPELPEDVYAKLPSILRQGCILFDEPRERDIYLLGLLTILSACIPNVKGNYDRRPVEANLYLMISASAASGKGTLKWSYQALDKILNGSKEEYEIAVAEYELESNESDNTRKPKPVRKSLVIPGNISVPALAQCLEENTNRGLVYETEADTIANTLKNDWGNYSDLLRKAFHHERISMRRRLDNEFVEVDHPCLSILLSGTPDQIMNLLGSTENGLFSRFLFYNFKGKVEWKNVFVEDNHHSNFSNYMGNELPVFTEIVYSICKKHNGILFEYTKEQQTIFGKLFTSWLLESDQLLGEESHATLKRLGLIHFRIAMILSTIRNHDKLVSIEKITCIDSDFEISTSIIECLKMHAFKIISSLKTGQNKNKVFSNGQQSSYYMFLPQQFEKAIADEKAKALKLNLKTAEKYLEVFIKNGILERPKHAHYQKTSQGINLTLEEA